MFNKLKAVLCLIVAVLLSASVMAQPKMRISEMSYDFGTIPQQARVAHTFWIKSVGSDTLKIIKVVPGCGCTKMPLEKTELAPGDSTKLEIVFSSRSYSRTIRKSPYIVTNEGPQKQRISFSANVFAKAEDLTPLVIEPSILKLSKLDGKDKVEFKIINKTDAEQTFENISFPKDLFEIKMPDKVAANGSATAQLVVKNGADVTKLVKSLTFDLTDANHSRYTLPINF